jgi:hypothetical protein
MFWSIKQLANNCFVAEVLLYWCKHKQTHNTSTHKDKQSICGNSWVTEPCMIDVHMVEITEEFGSHQNQIAALIYKISA